MRKQNKNTSTQSILKIHSLGSKAKDIEQILELLDIFQANHNVDQNEVGRFGEYLEKEYYSATNEASKLYKSIN